MSTTRKRLIEQLRSISSDPEQALDLILTEILAVIDDGIAQYQGSVAMKIRREIAVLRVTETNPTLSSHLEGQN